MDGHALLIGTERLLSRKKIATDGLTPLAETLAAAGKTPILVAIGGRPAAVIAVADQIKPGARETITALHDMGIETLLLTGDAPLTARAIAAELGIDRVEAGLLPKDKLARLEDIRRDGTRIAFVGDGINDAPALAAADVGLAIGTGTDAAIEAADVVLMSGDPRGVVDAIDISARTLRNIRQNLFWAFAYNIALIPVAAGLFFPLFGWQLSPMLGAAAMSLSSVFVLSNALRLRRVPARIGRG